MGLPVVVMASGGLAVTEASNGLGLRADVATNGLGIGVTIVSALGLPIIFYGPDGTPWPGGVAPGGTNTLVAGAGSFVLTGNDVSLTRQAPGAFTLTAAGATFVLSGETMTPLVDYRLPGEVGAFTLTGQNVTLDTTATGGTARQFADISIYRNAEATARSFAVFDHYVAA